MPEREPNGPPLPSDPNYHLLRQVHPIRRDEDWVLPLVFQPNSEDFGLASMQIRENLVERRAGLKPGQAFVLYTAPPPEGHGNPSVGVIAISTAGAYLAEVPPFADELPGDPFHACLDWRGLDGQSKAKKKARSLARAALLDNAEELGMWQYGPVEAAS